MKNKIYFFSLLSFVVLLLSSLTKAQVASGGTFIIEQATVSNGGGKSSVAGNLFTVEGTIGQAASGMRMTGGVFSQTGGLWTMPPSAPTAASVTVTGRVILDNDTGVNNAIAVLSGGPLITPRIARSNAFGYFTFEEIEVGHFYIISVQHKRYRFMQDNQGVMILDNQTDIIFHAISQQ